MWHYNMYIAIWFHLICTSLFDKVISRLHIWVRLHAQCMLCLRERHCYVNYTRCVWIWYSVAIKGSLQVILPRYDKIWTNVRFSLQPSHIITISVHQEKIQQYSCSIQPRPCLACATCPIVFWYQWSKFASSLTLSIIPTVCVFKSEWDI